MYTLYIDVANIWKDIQKLPVELIHQLTPKIGKSKTFVYIKDFFLTKNKSISIKQKKNVYEHAECLYRIE